MAAEAPYASEAPNSLADSSAPPYADKPHGQWREDGFAEPADSSLLGESLIRMPPPLPPVPSPTPPGSWPSSVPGPPPESSLAAGPRPGTPRGSPPRLSERPPEASLIISALSAISGPPMFVSSSPRSRIGDEDANIGHYIGPPRRKSPPPETIAAASDAATAGLESPSAVDGPATSEAAHMHGDSAVGAEESLREAVDAVANPLFGGDRSSCEDDSRETEACVIGPYVTDATIDSFRQQWDQTSLGSSKNQKWDSNENLATPLASDFVPDETNRTSYISEMLGLDRYARVVELHPWKLLLAYVLATILLVLCGWKTPVIDTSFSAFVRSDGEAMRNREALLQALKEMEDYGGRRLSSGVVFEPQVLTLLYEAVDGNILDAATLSEVRDFELGMRDLRGWQEMCSKSVKWSQWLCDIGESFPAYAFPSQPSANVTADSFGIIFDGRGKDLFPLSATFAHLEESYTRQSIIEGEWPQGFGLFFPSDFQPADVLDATGRGPPKFMRTRFVFPLLYGTTDDSRSDQSRTLQKLRTEYKAFVAAELYPRVVSAAAQAKRIRVLYSGDAVTMHEVDEALRKDIMLALGSILFVTAYMHFHIRNVLLTSGCFLIIFASVPIAYVLTPTPTVTIASFLSLFLITVIDIDVIFVFVEFWDQTQHMESIAMRLSWLIWHAGRSCLATSLTTSLSFFSNLASSLQPLREFGLFMGISVMAVFVLAMLILPPLICIRERKRRRAAAGASLRAVAPEESITAYIPPELNSHDFTAEGAVKSTVRPDSDTVSLPSSHNGSPQSSGSQSKNHNSVFMFEEDHGRTETCVDVNIFRIVDRMSRGYCACIVVAITVLSFPLLTWAIYTKLELDLGLPSVFPPGHQMVVGAEVIKHFDGAEKPNVEFEPRLAGVARSILTAPKVEEELVKQNLVIFNWCEARRDAAAPDNAAAGSCWRGPTLTGGHIRDGNIWSFEGCSAVTLWSRFAASSASSLTSSEHISVWNATWAQVADELANATLEVQLPATVQRVRLPSLVVENWETGAASTSPFFDSGGTMVLLLPRPPANASSCEVETLCFFGIQACQLAGWQEMLSRNLTLPSQLAPSRRAMARQPGAVAESLEDAKSLAAWVEMLEADEAVRDGVLPSRGPTRRLQGVPGGFDVGVVWGLRGPRSTPLIGLQTETWSFDPTFIPDNPWAQRAIFSMCEDMSEDLLVDTLECWAQPFRDWLLLKGRPFPSRSFDADLIEWLAEEEVNWAMKHIWLTDGKMRACKAMFFVSAQKSMPVPRTLKYMDKWSDHVESRNAKASITANKAWHSAATWVLAEAQISILASTVDTVLIECALSFIGILIFTGDPLISFLVLASVIVNINGLLFVMVVIFGWAISPIEAIFLIVFLGYSVTFGQHLANNYVILHADSRELEMIEDRFARYCVDFKGLPKELIHRKTKQRLSLCDRTPADKRRARARVAVLNVGAAVLSTTISTVGSSIFLIVCSMNIFIRLGVVVVTVVVLSVISTVITLPAVLMVFGPSENPWYKRLPLQMWRRLVA